MFGRAELLQRLVVAAAGSLQYPGRLVQQQPDVRPGVCLQSPFGAPQPPLALIELTQKNAGVKELREVVKRYPGTEEERRARAKLKELGVAVTASTAR